MNEADVVVAGGGVLDGGNTVLYTYSLHGPNNVRYALILFDVHAVA